MVTGWGRERERAWHRSSLISHGLQMSWERFRGCHGMLWESQGRSECVGQEEVMTEGANPTSNALRSTPPKLLSKWRPSWVSGTQHRGSSRILQKTSSLTVVRSKRIPTSYIVAEWHSQTSQENDVSSGEPVEKDQRQDTPFLPQWGAVSFPCAMRGETKRRVRRKKPWNTSFSKDI